MVVISVSVDSTGEATRLLAWLVKHSRGQASVAEMAVKCQGLTHLVTMTMADHAVMQNEAIMALTLVTSEALCKSRNHTSLSLF